MSAHERVPNLINTAEITAIQDQLIEAASRSCADPDVAFVAVLQQISGAVANAAGIASAAERVLVRVRRRMVQRNRSDVIVWHHLENDVLIAIAEGRAEHVGRVR